MARTHGLDKRLAEEKARMAKSGKHHGGSSITQDSVTPSGSAGKPYKSGANVGKGPKPAPGQKSGVSVAAGPKSGKKGK
jgi:hypothetical protein